MTDGTQSPLHAQHTPGPWDYDMDYIVAPDPNGRHPDIYIAEIAHSDDEGRVASYEQQDANRRLIAAAPELLEQLTLLADHLETPTHGLTEAMRKLRSKEARAAIAKAKGGAQ
jgi:hypothetical protein